MDEKNNLLIESGVLNLKELSTRIVEMQSAIDELSSSLARPSLGDGYQTGTITAPKGRFVAGAVDNVAIMDGQNPTYRFWAGKSNPSLAPFTVDKNGNVVAKSFATASTGERIVIETASTNTIKFYNNTTLYGILEVDTVGSDGYINLLAQDEGAGLKIYTGVGASSFSSVELLALGGAFKSNGNATNQYLIMEGGQGGFLQIHNGPSGEFLETNLLPVGDPGIPGALYIDAGGVVMQSL